MCGSLLRCAVLLRCCRCPLPAWLISTTFDCSQGQARCFKPAPVQLCSLMTGRAGAVRHCIAAWELHSQVVQTGVRRTVQCCAAAQPRQDKCTDHLANWCVFVFGHWLPPGTICLLSLLGVQGPALLCCGTAVWVQGETTAAGVLQRACAVAAGVWVCVCMQGRGPRQFCMCGCPRGWCVYVCWNSTVLVPDRRINLKYRCLRAHPTSTLRLARCKCARRMALVGWGLLAQRHGAGVPVALLLLCDLEWVYNVQACVEELM